MYKFEVGDEVEIDYPIYVDDYAKIVDTPLVGVIDRRERTPYDEYEADEGGNPKYYVDYRISLKDLSLEHQRYFGHSDDYPAYVWVEEERIRPLDRNSIRFVSRRVYEEAYRV